MSREEIKLSVQDLAMYIGCEMEYVTPNGKIRISLNTFWLHEINSIISIDLFKPILRPLSDMTEEEQEVIRFKDYLDIVTHQRKVAENFKYLISKKFDVFGWIEKGLAINQTTNP